MTREEKSEDIQREILKEQNKERNKKIIKIIVKTIFIFVVFFILFFSYTTYISTIKVGVREYRIINKKIPDSFNGFKIIQFSDLHYGSTIYEKEMKKIVNLVNERKPDLIVFTGDLINKDYSFKKNEQERFINELKSMNSTIGKYAILGDEDNEGIATIFNQSDFTILRNEYELIYHNDNTPILLVGLLSSSKGQDISLAYKYFSEEIHNPDIYTISLLHEPDSVEDIINTYPTDLFLAGHSHNGNIRLPFIKYSIFKVKGAYKYDQDYYSLNDSKLYISSGLGTKNGIRLNCRPSINFFRLSNN